MKQPTIQSIWVNSATTVQHHIVPHTTVQQSARSEVKSATTVQHHTVPHTTVQESTRNEVKSATTVEAATGNFGGGKWIAHCSLVCVLLWCYLTQPWLTFILGWAFFWANQLKTPFTVLLLSMYRWLWPYYSNIVQCAYICIRQNLVRLSKNLPALRTK